VVFLFPAKTDPNVQRLVAFGEGNVEVAASVLAAIGNLRRFSRSERNWSAISDPTPQSTGPMDCVDERHFAFAGTIASLITSGLDRRRLRLWHGMKPMPGVYGRSVKC
jgi:hypothetical protein